jgi:hypothetical protein
MRGTGTRIGIGIRGMEKVKEKKRVGEGEKEESRKQEGKRGKEKGRI